MPLPNFLIIGAQKSGTTSLRYYLQEHPEISLAPKETHFFDDRDNTFNFGVEYYSRLFEESGDANAIGEVTPCYIYAKQAPERMHQTIPNAKLILIMRNPVDRAYSHFWKNIKNGKETHSFNEAIQLEKERIDRNFWHRMHYSYRDRGIYYEQIERYLKYFPIQNMRFLIFEEFTQDSNSALQSIYQFLDVDDNFQSTRTNIVKNKAAISKSKLLFRLAKGHYHFPSGVELFIKKSRFKSLIMWVNKKFNIQEFDYPPMDRNTRQRLLELYRLPNDRLSELLGRDLSIWEK